MQIEKLRINGFKSFSNFLIDFNNNEGGSSTILIGENGAGKSSMLEVILLIIASFDSPAIAGSIEFDFGLIYNYAQEQIGIHKKGDRYTITFYDRVKIISGRLSTVIGKLEKEDIKIFPKRVIVYYSGIQDKMLPIYSKVNSHYTRKCKSTIIEYLKYISTDNVKDKLEISFPDRKYNYCFDNFTDVFLASLLLDETENAYEKEILTSDCRFDRISRIDIYLDIKHWKNIFDYDGKSGSVPRALLDVIHFIEPALVELFLKNRMGINGGKVFVSLREFSDFKIGRVSIFNAFEKLYTLFDAEFDVSVDCSGDIISTQMISEGQRQLIKVLGMLGLNKNEDCLVIMDEPDAYMNPKWKYNLKKIIDNCLLDTINTQALITTHDPLVINGVDKEFIRIFAVKQYSGLYRSVVYKPVEDTKGMGIDGLLQSEYYGLRTSYDEETSKRFIHRRLLYIKLMDGVISDEEKKELRDLSKELGSLPISNNTIEFIYDDFLKAYKDSGYYTKEYLTHGERIARNERIKEIVSQLFEGE